MNLNSLYAKQSQKQALLNVIAPLAFWSYDKNAIQNVPDAKLIEAVLLHGNDPLRKRLFRIFRSKQIRKIWESRIVIRGANYEHLNKKIASEYLHIGDPDNYIKEAYSKHNLYDRFSAADA